MVPAYLNVRATGGAVCPFSEGRGDRERWSPFRATDGAARGELSLLRLSRVVTEVDEVKGDGGFRKYCYFSDDEYASLDADNKVCVIGGAGSIGSSFIR